MTFHSPLYRLFVRLLLDTQDGRPPHHGRHPLRTKSIIQDQRAFDNGYCWHLHWRWDFSSDKPARFSGDHFLRPFSRLQSIGRLRLERQWRFRLLRSPKKRWRLCSVRNCRRRVRFFPFRLVTPKEKPLLSVFGSDAPPAMGPITIIRWRSAGCAIRAPIGPDESPLLGRGATLSWTIAARGGWPVETPREGRVIQRPC